MYVWTVSCKIHVYMYGYVGTVWVLVSFFSNLPRLGDFSLLGLVLPGLVVRSWFTCYLSGDDDDNDHDHEWERKRERERLRA